jgi:hypothetical protein
LSVNVTTPSSGAVRSTSRSLTSRLGGSLTGRQVRRR